MTTEAQKQPKIGGMYDMVPTVDALFLSCTEITFSMSIISEEKTASKPGLIPTLFSRFRSIRASLQLNVFEISVTETRDGSNFPPAHSEETSGNPAFTFSLIRN